MSRQGLTDFTLQNCSLAELRVESYNKEVGDLKGYDCSVCKNKGMIAVIREEDGEDIYRQCDCLEIRRALRRVNDSGLKELIAEKRFETFNILDETYQQVIDKAKAYAEDPNGWFVMDGKSGTGKTHICTAIVGKLLANGMPCKYMLWREEAPVLKAKASDPEYGLLIKPYKEAKCLYIDDLFKGGITQGDLNLAFEIINHRYLKGLLTIISTEKFITEILELDEAIGGRIYEMAKSNLIQIKNWKNYRLMK